MQLAFIGMPGTTELMIIAGIIAILVIPAKLPKIARSLGAIPAAFRRGVSDGEKEDKNIDKESE